MNEVMEDLWNGCERPKLLLHNGNGVRKERW